MSQKLVISLTFFLKNSALRTGTAWTAPVAQLVAENGVRVRAVLQVSRAAMKKIVLSLVVLAFACMALADDKSAYLDMTYRYNAETLHHPVHPDFNLTVLIRGSEEFGIYIESNSICLAEHTGTHIDAPSHFAEGKWRIDDVPLESLIGPGVRIDIKSKADANADALMEVSDIEAWEETYGRIPEGSIVMVYTGWGSRWGDRLRYLGTETRNASLLHYPGITGGAAQALLDRKVITVGIDTPSMDNAPSTTFSAHITLLSANIPILENVANVDKLPNIGSTIFALPMKIDEGSGAPVRIIATGWRSDVPNPCSTGAGHQLLPYMGLMVFMLCASLFRT
ncbi:isatin hydrolase-like [Glandiceps talaboti]